MRASTDQISDGGTTRQQARLSVKAGRRAGMTLDVGVTTGGLLAIGGLVAAILVSTAVLVGVAGMANRSRGSA